MPGLCKEQGSVAMVSDEAHAARRSTQGKAPYVRASN